VISDAQHMFCARNFLKGQIRMLSVKKIAMAGLQAVLASQILLAGGNTIGVASTRGIFELESRPVKGNATLSNGSTLSTSHSTGNVRLNDGTNLLIDTTSNVSVYSQHAELKSGAVQFNGGNAGYSLSSGHLRIVPESSVSRGVLRRRGSVIEVAALSGNWNVFGAKGMHVLRLTAGKAYAFSLSGSGANAPSQNKGTLTKKDSNHYLNVAETSKSYKLIDCKVPTKLEGQEVVINGTVVQDGSAIACIGREAIVAASTAGVVAATAAGTAGAAAGAAGTAGAVGAAAGAAAAGLSTAAITGITILGAASVVGVTAAVRDEAEVTRP
jgi:hypothetical protein